MKQNLKFMTWIAIFFALLFAFLKFKKGVRDQKTICYYEKQSSFNGKISKIKVDSLNHPTSTIYFTNGYIFKGIEKHTHGLWIGLKPGDSIVKFSNSLQYIVYHDSNQYLIDTVFANEDCP